MAKKRVSKRNPSGSATTPARRKSATKKSANKKKTGSRPTSKKSVKKRPATKKKATKKAATKKRPAKKRVTKKRATTKKSSKASAAKNKGIDPTDRQAVRKEVLKRAEELEIQRRKAEQVLDAHRTTIMAMDGVSGVRVDLRMKDGKYVEPLQYVICVDVEIKYHPKHSYFKAGKHTMLAKTIDGVAVDVQQACYQACECDSGQEDVLHEPLLGGIAIAPHGRERNWGTMGLVVQSRGGNRLLTNWHVSSRTIGKKIVQPPNSMGHIEENDQVVGDVAKVSALKHRFVEASLVRPNGNRTLSNGVLGLSGFVEEGRALRSGDQHVTHVFIVGAATGPANIREGVVTNVNHTVTVPKIRVEAFENQILVETIDGDPIICSGDSGAILFREYSRGGDIVNSVVGLAFASKDGRKSLVANHFHNVAEELGIFLD